MNRAAKYRLGLNTSQTHLRDLLALKSDVVIATMFRALRSNLDVHEAWPNNALAKSASLPFFTIQGIASDTGLSTDTVDKYVHAFIGLTQDDPDYRAKRVTFDHSHAPLIIETKEPDGGFAYEIASGRPFRQINPAADETYTDEFGNEVILPFGAMPHRLVSTRAMLFTILAPTTIKSSATSAALKAARRRLTEEFGLPAITSESIDGNYREFKRRPEDAFTSGSDEGNAEQLDLFGSTVSDQLPPPPSEILIEEPERRAAILPPGDWRADLDSKIEQAKEARDEAHEAWLRLVSTRGMLDRLECDLGDVDPTVRDRLLSDLFHAKMGLR